MIISTKYYYNDQSRSMRLVNHVAHMWLMIYICVYMYIHVYIYVYIMCIYMHTYMYIYIYVCVHIYMFGYIYVCIYIYIYIYIDRLCGLVVRVSGYRYRGPGFDPRRYQIF